MVLRCDARPMKRDLMDILCCPVHKTDLALRVTKEEGGEVLEGALRCEQCRFDYPIEEGIPNLLPPELHERPGPGRPA
jgi:uncharacterized protein YbaR (Trm112 family)